MTTTTIKPGYYMAKGKSTLLGRVLTKREAMHSCGMALDGVFDYGSEVDHVPEMVQRGYVFTRLVPESELVEAKADAASWAEQAEARTQDVVRLGDELGAAHQALNDLLVKYVNLALSGDAGYWDPELEPEVIEARAVLEKGESRQ